nr:hypothetical protein [Kluyvera ascorbata]
MGITSAGMQSRNGGCGEYVHARTARQNRQNTTVHYLVSPPRSPHIDKRTNQQAKAKVLARLEVATRRK